MKHGDKTKGKASKASGKKASQSGKSTGKAASSKTKGKSVPEKVSTKTSTKAAGKPQAGNGAGATRPAGDGFSNPIVGAAFKHAVKKYPNAFRKLTD